MQSTTKKLLLSGIFFTLYYSTAFASLSPNASESSCYDFIADMSTADACHEFLSKADIPLSNYSHVLIPENSQQLTKCLQNIPERHPTDDSGSGSDSGMTVCEYLPLGDPAKDISSIMVFLKPATYLLNQTLLLEKNTAFVGISDTYPQLPVLSTSNSFAGNNLIVVIAGIQLYNIEIDASPNEQSSLVNGNITIFVSSAVLVEGASEYIWISDSRFRYYRPHHKAFHHLLVLGAIRNKVSIKDNHIETQGFITTEGGTFGPSAIGIYDLTYHNEHIFTLSGNHFYYVLPGQNPYSPFEATETIAAPVNMVISMIRVNDMRPSTSLIIEDNQSHAGSLRNIYVGISNLAPTSSGVKRIIANNSNQATEKGRLILNYLLTSRHQNTINAFVPVCNNLNYSIELLDSRHLQSLWNSQNDCYCEQFAEGSGEPVLPCSISTTSTSTSTMDDFTQPATPAASQNYTAATLTFNTPTPEPSLTSDALSMLSVLSSIIPESPSLSENSHETAVGVIVVAVVVPVTLCFGLTATLSIGAYVLYKVCAIQTTNHSADGLELNLVE